MCVLKIIVDSIQLKLNAFQDEIQNIPSFVQLGSLIEQKTFLFVLMAPQHEWKNEQRK